MNVTRARLQELLAYEPDTGIFRWKVTKANAVAGSRAGCRKEDGRRVIRIDGRLYRESRLAWLYQTGKWPERGIDHKNGDPSDNRFNNLREACQTLNNANKRVVRNGLKGVVQITETRFVARISAFGARIHIGSFRTEREAHEAYIREAKKIFGEYARAS